MKGSKNTTQYFYGLIQLTITKNDFISFETGLKKVKNKQLFNHNNCPYFLKIYDSDLDDRLFELHKPLMRGGSGDDDDKSYFARRYDKLIEIAKERSPHDVINIEIMKEYILKIDEPNPRDIDTKIAILYDEYMGTFEFVNNYEVYNNYFPFYLLYLRQNPKYQDKKQEIDNLEDYYKDGKKEISFQR